MEDIKEQITISKQDTTTTLPTISTSITTSTTTSSSTSHYLTEEERQEMVRETLEGLTAEMLFTQPSRTMEHVVGSDVASSTHTDTVEHSVGMDIVIDEDGEEKQENEKRMLQEKVKGKGEERGKEKDKGEKRRREEEEVEAKKREGTEGEDEKYENSTVRGKEENEHYALLKPTNPPHPPPHLPFPSHLYPPPPPPLNSSLPLHLQPPPTLPPPPNSNPIPCPVPTPAPCPGPVSSLKRVAVSDIEIDTHVTHILNYTFPRSSFGSDLWREQR